MALCDNRRFGMPWSFCRRAKKLQPLTNLRELYFVQSQIACQEQSDKDSSLCNEHLQSFHMQGKKETP
jgi:hypothetical protein